MPLQLLNWTKLTDDINVLSLRFEERAVLRVPTMTLLRLRVYISQGRHNIGFQVDRVAKGILLIRGNLLTLEVLMDIYNILYDTCFLNKGYAFVFVTNPRRYKTFAVFTYSHNAATPQSATE